MAVLKEESYFVDGRGRVQTQEKYLNFENAFRLSVKYYFTQPLNNSKVDYGDGGWEAMLQGLETRNRISHPKLTAQLAVTDNELETVKKAKKWADDLMHKLFGEKTRYLLSVVEAITNRQFKYPLIIHVGRFCGDSGVDEIIQDFMYYEGKKITRIVPDEIVPHDVIFPIQLMFDRGNTPC